VTRRVRHLHLTGSSARDLRAADHHVRDALRTASVPGLRPGRMLVIRTLPLGHIDPRRPPQALARQISERLRHLEARAVPYTLSAAASSPAVWFPSLPQARAAFLARRATQQPTSAWFWRSAVQDPSPDDPVPVLLERWLRPQPPARITDPPPLVQVGRLLLALAQHEPPARLLEQIPEQVAAAWVGPHPPALPDPPEPHALPPEPPGVEPVLGARLLHAARQAPPTSARARLLALVAWVAPSPRRASHPLALHRARALLAPAARPDPVPEPPPPAAPPAETHPTPEPRPVVAPNRPSRPSVQWDPPASPSPDPPPAAPPAAEPEPTPPASTADRPEPRWLDERALPRPARHRLGPPPPLTAPAWTPTAGLLFFIHPLIRLGLGDAHQHQPELLDQALGWRVLDHLGAALQIPHDDPALRAIAPRDPPRPPGGAPFVLPTPCWDLLSPGEPLLQTVGADGALLLGAPPLWLARWRPSTPGQVPPAVAEHLLTAPHPVRPAPPLDPPHAEQAHVSGWSAAALRAVSALQDVDPVTLVRRSGVVSASRTHVDVVLPLGSVAMPVRRQALDTDPGWVPWLGRVVRFHYVEDDDYDSLVAQVRASTSS